MQRHDGEEEKEEPNVAAEEVCRFETDLAFLSEVGRRIARAGGAAGPRPGKS